MAMIVSWNPTYAYFGNPYEWGAFEIDLDRFARLIKGKLRPGPKVLLIHPTAADVKRLVKEARAIALDIETKAAHPDEPWTGKDPTRARLRSLGLGCETWGLSHIWTTGNLPVEREMKRVIEDPKILKITQNGPWFDFRVLQRYGMVMR